MEVIATQTTAKGSVQKSSLAVLAIGAVLLLLAFQVNDGAGVLTAEMLRTVLLTACAILIWVRQPTPIGVSSLMVIALLPMLGLKTDLNDAFSGMANAANFFVVASFGVSIAIRKTTVLDRMLAKLLGICKGKGNYVVLAFMAVMYIVSMIMSDIAAVVISIAFAADIIACLPEEEKGSLGKVLMLSLPFASVIGGTATPAGSTVNVMVLNLLQQNCGAETSFLQWTLTDLPISVVLLFVA